jgi:hypothetical protein
VKLARQIEFGVPPLGGEELNSHDPANSNTAYRLKLGLQTAALLSINSDDCEGIMSSNFQVLSYLIRRRKGYRMASYRLLGHSPTYRESVVPVVMESVARD